MITVLVYSTVLEYHTVQYEYLCRYNTVRTCAVEMLLYEQHRDSLYSARTRLSCDITIAQVFASIPDGTAT